MLFTHKIGFSYEAITHYYLGDGDLLVQKTNFGLLKLVLPHIFAFALLGFVMIHFLIFTPYKEKSYPLFMIYLLLFTQTVEIFSPFLIINISEYFSYLKLLSFIIYMSLVPIILFWLLKTILNR